MSKAFNKIPKKYKITSKIAEACQPKNQRKRKKQICQKCSKEFMSNGLRLCPECQPARSTRSNFARHHKFHGSQSDMVDDD